MTKAKTKASRGAARPAMPARLAADLLAWYDRHRRDLPWRAKPGARSESYRVWLSEIMQQQTTVAAVVPYYQGKSTRRCASGERSNCRCLSAWEMCRSRALTLGHVADILEARGELDEALRIRREDELPVYERLGDTRALLIGRATLALTLLNRNHKYDREEAGELLKVALTAAEAMRLPEVETIRAFQRRYRL